MRANYLSAWSPGTAAKWQLAFAQLLEATFYAQDLQKPIWEFAVEIESLRLAGLTTNDLYWLRFKGYIEQVAKSKTRNLRHRQWFCVERSPPSSRERRVILTDAGLAFALRHCRRPPRSVTLDPAARTGSAKRTSAVPRWDQSSRTLWLGSVVVKRLRVPAHNQELVFGAFEEEGWPTSIDDPLPPVEGIDCKQRLHDTIKRLNRRHRHLLMRFTGNGNGDAIQWKRIRGGRHSAPRSAPKRP